MFKMISISLYQPIEIAQFYIVYSYIHFGIMTVHNILK